LPVQKVRLALYFPALQLDAFSLSGIRTVWSDYAKASLLPPATFRDIAESPKQTTDQTVSEHWPLGLMMFESGQYGETVLCQADRIGVTWDTKQTELPYPEYEQMKQILAERFGQFTDTLSRNGVDSLPVPNCCECTYENLVEDVPASLLMYRVIGGRGTPDDLPTATSDLLKHHFHWGSRSRYAQVIVVSSPKRATRLVFEVTAEQSPESSGWESDLDLCHNQARKLYGDYIAGAM